VLGRIGPLSLSLLGDSNGQGTLSAAAFSLASWLLALLRAKVSSTTDVRVRASIESLRALSVPGGRVASVVEKDEEIQQVTVDRVLNLALDAECGQACVFCSVKSFVRPTDGGEDELERQLAQLRRAREQGVEELRLNGIDPLAFSRVVDLVTGARTLGFRRLHIYSPGRRLSDAVFRKALLAAAPASLAITVPLYGITAAVHDEVTGTPGAFQQVKSAIDALARELGPGRLSLSTVVVRRNASEFAGIVEFARERGLALESKLAYPMRQTTRDPYADAALRESDVVEAFVAARASRPVDDDALAAWAGLSKVLKPCVAWHAERRWKLPVFGAYPRPTARPSIAGTEYRSSQFVHAGDSSGESDAFAVSTVPCAREAECALATSCPREHYAVYVERFGAAEFEPVSAWELYRAGAHPLVALAPATTPAQGAAQTATNLKGTWQD